MTGETKWAKNRRFTGISKISLIENGDEKFAATTKILFGAGKLIDNGLIYVDQVEASGDSKKRNSFSAPYIYLLLVLFPSPPFLPITISLLYIIRTILSFPTHCTYTSVYISFFQRWSPVL